MRKERSKYPRSKMRNQRAKEKTEQKQNRKTYSQFHQFQPIQGKIKHS